MEQSIIYMVINYLNKSYYYTTNFEIFSMYKYLFF